MRGTIKSIGLFVIAIIFGMSSVGTTYVFADILPIDAEVAPIETVGNPEKALLRNPVHECAEDYSEWDYVYFGMYPQSQVTDAALITAIVAKAEEEGIEIDIKNSSGGCADVNYNGNKYRIYTEGYDEELDENIYFCFLWEKIKWRVLAVDNEKFFLMADSALDSRYRFGKSNEWENSEIRTWLNREFLGDAFTYEECNAIKMTKICDSGSALTEDKIFLLSKSDVVSSKYGFCKENNKDALSENNPTRIVYRTQYADYMDNYVTYDVLDSDWILRTKTDEDNVAYVNTNGLIGETGYRGQKHIVPALYIEKDSKVWEGVEDKDIIENPTHYCSLEYDKTFYSYVYFGSYPMSLVTDTTVIEGLKQKYGESKGTVEFGLRYNGCFYKKDAQDNYFKVEKIKWRVLEVQEDKIFLHSDQILDYISYCNYDATDASWAKSNIRAELNDHFFETAFSKEEQKAIISAKLDNGEDEATEDKVFLLSLKDIGNTTYGYCTNTANLSAGRVLKCTEAAQLDNVNDFDEREDYQYAWWLRTPGRPHPDNTDMFATYVNAIGGCDNESISGLTSSSSAGIAPAIYVDINSPLWSTSKTEVRYDESSSDENINTDNEDKKTDVTPTIAPKGTKLKSVDLSTTSGKIPFDSTFTVTNDSIDNPTVAFDGVNQKTSNAVSIPAEVIYKGVTYKVTTASPKSFTDNKSKLKYSVVSNKIGGLAVKCSGYSDKKKTSFTIPKSVTYKGIKYSVTQIASKAFQKNKKVKAITIGASVTSIGSKAFYKCSNLKTINVKGTKLKTVGKNALKDIHKNCKIKVPSKKYKEYKRLFKGKGQKSTVKVKK